MAYLGQPQTALISIAFVDNWHFWGFLMVLFLAAMQSNRAGTLRSGPHRRGHPLAGVPPHHDLPGIRPTIVFMLLMVSIWSFLVFDYVWMLTQGGPAGASEVLGSLVYKEAFMRFEAGYASAIGLTMSFLAGLIICLFIYLRRRGWEI